jgi:hypothetical protein
MMKESAGFRFRNMNPAGSVAFGRILDNRGEVAVK